MNKAILTVGLSGSGKSTWAKKYVEDNSNWVRINRDDLRNMRGVYWKPKEEKMITDFQLGLAEIAIAHKKNIIIDDTNLNPKTLNMWTSFFKERQYEIEIKNFKDVPLETCIKNDLKRPNSVGEKVIVNQYNKYIANKITELKQDENLPNAIIVDLDGTLALYSPEKNPYDRDFINDKLSKPVSTILKLEQSIGTIILIFSGRNSKFKTETEEWLKNNNVQYNRLYMRPENDNRKDTLIKKEMFDSFAINKYNIKYIIDDRPQVVRFWRSMGLFVLDVNQSGLEF